VPATIEPGTQTIDIQASDGYRALRPSRGSIEFVVEETPTELNVTAIETTDGVEITGQLTTTADTSVGSRPVTLHVGNETDTVQTDTEGWYSTSIDIDSTAESTTVIATYEEPEANLASSRAETTIITEDDSGVIAAVLSTLSAIEFVGLDILRESPILVGVIGFATVIVGLAVRRRYGREPADGSTEANAQTGIETTETNESASPSIEALLETAREKLETNPKTAVYASYAAVRTQFDTSADRTHRELYEEQRPVEDTRLDEAFRTLTETFERAAFAADEITTTQAESALQAAEQYLDTADRNESTAQSTD
jgi:hypothetical protein